MLALHQCVKMASDRDETFAIVTVTTAKWTLDEYHRMVAAGILSDRRVELLRGDIVEMAPEGPVHADCVNYATHYLAQLLGDRALVRSASPVTLSDRSEPEPDLAIVRLQRYRERHPYPEDIFWLVEFSNSTLRKDTDIKSAIYAIAGVREYWIADLNAMRLIILREPTAGNYRSCRVQTSGEICPLAFPEIAIAVDRWLGG